APPENIHASSKNPTATSPVRTKASGPAQSPSHANNGRNRSFPSARSPAPDRQSSLVNQRAEHRELWRGTVYSTLRSVEWLFDWCPLYPKLRRTFCETLHFRNLQVQA